jgi:quinoprotein glucose dehydrogenase
MKILVTGAAGFLGSRLARALLAGAPGLPTVSKLVAVDIAACRIDDPRVEWKTGTLTDDHFTKSIVEADVDVVYHLAAVVSGQAEAEFDLGMRVNVDATRTLLDACRRLEKPPRFVFTSTLAVFGNNLFSSSVVAVDANTGKYLWHFQLVHHDIWDYDTQSAPLLVDLRRDGQMVPAVIIVNKTGLMFTLNRVTGKPIFDIEERAVPKSDVPGEQASPTQPFPVKPEPLTQNTISRNNLYKGEPQHQSYCEHLVDDNNMKLGGPFMPIALNQYSISPPGPAGGINFWGPSYDPELHLFISNTSNIFQPMRLIQREDGSYANSGPLAGTRRFGDPDRKLLCGPTPWGELVAVNMDTGNIAYRKTLGVSDALPAGLQDTGRPSSGGVVLTASGLTFVGGTDDFRFRAFATATGEKLWEIRLPSSVETTPTTYLGADGRQFVTVVSTGGGLTGSAVTNDEIIAFALPKQ